MWQQAAGFEGELAQLRHSFTAGKPPAEQTHIWRNARFPVERNLCVRGQWSVLMLYPVT